MVEDLDSAGPSEPQGQGLKLRIRSGNFVNDMLEPEMLYLSLGSRGDLQKLFLKP
jgi:hypothetical protein